MEEPLHGNVRIVVDVNSVEFVRNADATGVLFWNVGGLDFPADGWSDFPFVLLGWWCDAMIRILRGESESEQLWFMDGPFRIDLTAKESDLIVAFVDRRGGENVVAEARVHVSVVARDILMASEALTRLCQAKEQSDPELGMLRTSSDSLRSVLSQSKTTE
ncbi:MAG: hypothetical protein NTW96_24925 [Planctomycetia bacterium]|nr:hypothetical protein [Planctomycetia bacterium]